MTAAGGQLARLPCCVATMPTPLVGPGGALRKLPNPPETIRERAERGAKSRVTPQALATHSWLPLSQPLRPKPPSQGRAGQPASRGSFWGAKGQDGSQQPVVQICGLQSLRRHPQGGLPQAPSGTDPLLPALSLPEWNSAPNLRPNGRPGCLLLELVFGKCRSHGKATFSLVLLLFACSGLLAGEKERTPPSWRPGRVENKVPCNGNGVCWSKGRLKSSYMLRSGGFQLDRFKALLFLLQRKRQVGVTAAQVLLSA